MDIIDLTSPGDMEGKQPIGGGFPMSKTPPPEAASSGGGKTAKKAARTDRFRLSKLRASWKRQRKAAISAVTQNWRTLKTATFAFKNDKDVVMAAVRQSGLALRFASDRLNGRCKLQRGCAAVRFGDSPKGQKCCDGSGR